jgi:hypothetical protein
MKGDSPPISSNGHSAEEAKAVNTWFTTSFVTIENNYLRGKTLLGLDMTTGLKVEPRLLRTQEHYPVPNTYSSVLNERQFQFLNNTLSQLCGALRQTGLDGMAYFVQQQQTALSGVPTATRSKTTVVSIVDAVFSILGRASQDIAIDTKVVSYPVKSAQVAVSAFGHVELQTLTDSTTIRNVYRGIYTYEVKRDGWKTGTGELNLIDRPGERIACTLKDQSSKLDSICEVR